MRALSLFREESAFWQVVGPLFILSALALTPDDPLSFALGLIGLSLCYIGQVRGFAYSLVLLGVVGVIQHGFFAKSHLWQFGIEGSFALAFLITALSTERRESQMKTLFGTLDASQASLQNLEEEIGKVKEMSTSQQLILQEKIEQLQKELEERESNHSSLLILNEVLRRTAAIHAEEKKAMKEEMFDFQANIETLQKELEAANHESDRLKNESLLAVQNRELTEALNAARFDREQSRLISEALAKEHALLQSEVLLLQGKEGALREELASLQNEIVVAQGKQEALQSEVLAARGQEEALKGEVAALQKEIATKQACPQEDIAPLYEKIRSLHQYEGLYKQLRTQFEEKNSVLHQTRAQLFKIETELQTLKMGKEESALEASPLAQEVFEEVVSLEEENRLMVREIAELQDIVGRLIENPIEDAPKRKKKVKKIPEQELLF